MNLLDIFEGREPYQQAIDKLEQRRIEDLEAKMDDCARRGDKEGFQKCKAERDSYHKVKEGEVTKTATGLKHRGTYGTEYSKSGVEFAKQKHHADLNKVDKTLTKNLEKGMDIKMDEGSMKQWLWNEAERMDRDAFVANAGEYGMSDEEAAEWWDDINGVEESGIGQDIVNKTEKMARATPQSRTGAVASTVKNAAKWLAGKGGPGKEGPTYEGADDVEDRGEYDQEGNMAKDNIHTIVRNARELESVISDNDNLPEWVQDKLANIKGMMTAVSEYMQTQHEREPEGQVAISEKLKGLTPKKLGSARDLGKSVRKFRAQRGLEEAGTDSQWSKESDWKVIPKAKSGRPADPRGEVTHLSDVARREAERNADQKKNSEEVDEDRARDLTAVVMLKKAHAAFPSAQDDAEALALWIADKEQRDVNRLERENDEEDALIARIMDQLKNKGVEEGWSDAIVAQRTGRPRTPYSVYIKGKKWKDFENEDHAEAVANKLRAKFETDGRDPDVITIAATGSVDEGATIAYIVDIESEYGDKGDIRVKAKDPQDAIRKVKAKFKDGEYAVWPTGVRRAEAVDEAANPAQQAAIAIAMKRAGKKPKSVDEGARGDAIKQGYQAAVKGLTKQQNPYYKSVNGQTPPEAYDWEAGWEDARDSGKIPQGVAEAQTDYQKRRQRERDVDAGKPVRALPKNPQTDYARKRAKDKRDMELGEMDKSQPSQERHGDYPLGAPTGTPAKPVRAKKVVKDLAKDLNNAFDLDNAFDKVKEEKTRLDPKCWTGKKIGNPKTKVKGGVRVNNCVPAEESYTGVMESQGVTDPKMLAVARRIDAFAKTVK